MLKWAIILAIVGVVFGALGFGGVASGFEGVAKILFALFLIGAAVTLFLGIFAAKKVL